MPRIPDWLRYETQHRIERAQERFQALRVRESLNDSPKAIAIIAVASVLLLVIAFWSIRRPAVERRYDPGKTAWFYDMNTGKLFVAKNKGPDPITAPSGPSPDGGPAGFRAHVYSYVLHPNESELFVGFLQKSAPDDGSAQRASVKNSAPDWLAGTLIRGIDADEPCPWVSPASREGREIMESLTRPNERGQSPIYQLPKER